MSQLKLNVLMWPALFVQQRGSDAPEAVAGKYTNQEFRFKTPAASDCAPGLGLHLNSSMTSAESPSCPWGSAFPERVFRAIYPHDLIALQHGEMNFSIT